MPSKTETRFFCQSCGNDYPRWYGQCPSCGTWNSLVEEKIRNPKSEILNKSKSQNLEIQKPLPIAKIDYKKEDRMPSGIAELDRVLGGGIVPGSVILFGGDPGIGKSTLMLQIANQIKGTVLYVSGEESARQIRMRAERLGTLSKSLNVLPETDLFSIENAANELKPSLLIIDSIQTVYRDDIPTAPGSVSQVRECAAYLTRIAKSSHLPILIVGHVTKEGSIAGPRILEHIVDAVLYFEGDMHKQFRILRGVKNRFGSLNEVGIFEMKEQGLVAVANPSQMFLSERSSGQSGSVVTSTIEGTRPLLLEVQALTSHTGMAVPRRTAVGVDYNRASIVIAVLERRANFKLGSDDIYINVAGGIRMQEPACDLPIAVAIASCHKNKPVDPKTVVVGEVGLAGEIRAVDLIESRVMEAEKLGFERIVIPKGNLSQLKKTGILLEPVANISEALQASL
ncbi:MAG TPA: DNA repair protein RadA [Candidatus Omnitrophota bacterium]|nr:DNA repair protein RadA [Candidatus Omnitrophota bacterium]